ncbi:hypothetical protein FQA39_LY07817 [Lamprigera yunnana]|nr:hypothetical protein FQA39_LY07817 [Lamprigera yunnana]
MTDLITAVPEIVKIDDIKPINSNTVHRICSGQVVFNLAIAVKELVENAIDAKATKIEVRLTEYGSELVEVSDNGSGVRSDYFQALTLKHHTSKLKQFNDLESLETLGFRGEALSSLCALSSVVITTRHASSEYGTKISYDSNGVITHTVPAPREIGTTVSLESLFSSLPVRRRAFTKNLKKEYVKMCQLLYAYCLVSKGVKFTCTNMTRGQVRSVFVSTEGSNSVRENVISVFGTKQITSLLEINMIDPEEDVLNEYKIKLLPGEPLSFNFELIISSAVHGSGRSTNDRQFFYVNDRPCEPSKIIKLVNEIYKQFNPHQYPFVFLNIIMEKSCVDVNVTPDKRQIFLEKEKVLLATLKTSLLEVFKSCPSMYVLSINPDMEKVNKTKIDKTQTSCSKTQEKLHIFEKPAKKTKALLQSTLITNDAFKVTKERENSITENEQPLKKFKAESNVPLLRDTLHVEIKKSVDIEMKSSTPIQLEEKVSSSRVSCKTNISDEICRSQKDLTKETEAAKTHKHITALASMSHIKELLNSCRKIETGDAKVRFRSEITPASNKNAEEELKKQITKDMFHNMDIIGQFNLGFIITKLGNDLFIVDQHATDEKYNFEQLQLNTVINSQVLVNPSSLVLSAANEELLISNLEVFEKNGFKFIIEPDAPATKKVKLAAIPISKNCIFGKEDIEEMLFMMQEEVNVSVCRPSRIRSMFASRACRKSVMVGCPLDKTEMRRLVDHMGEIDQPWNCPHGRPTMRYLVNLNLVDNF